MMLLHIEALKLPGKGRMKTTGTLGDVMLSLSTGGKEPRLLSHTLSALAPPYTHLPPVALGWSPNDDLVSVASPANSIDIWIM